MICDKVMICDKAMICDNDTKTIVETAYEYALKYDEKTEGLRDKTISELIKEYGPKIRCPCMNREYQVNSQSINSHFNCQKHKNWIIKSQKEHIEKYGHCCSPQDIVNSQNKDLRNLKCIIHGLTNKNKTLVEENAKLEELNKSYQDEIAQYKEKEKEKEKEKDEEEDEDEEENFTECN